jgi:hypothetical protein
VALVGLLCCSLSGISPAEDSLQWRGTEGQGHSAATQLPITWNEQGFAWTADLPGRGWSSPVVRGDQIWLTTAIETQADPESAKKRLASNTGDQPLTLLESVQFRAVCVDRSSGQLMHDVLLMEKYQPQWVHALNSYASPTPVLDHEKLYCHFGAYGTIALDTRHGKVLWTNTDLEVMHENGPGGSPVTVDGLLVVNMDGSDRQFIAALDTTTGALEWKTERSGTMHPHPQQKKSYGTPLVMTLGGVKQIVSPASDWLYGYEPGTGKELWKIPYGELGFSVTPRPVVGLGHIFMATGFGKGQILALRIEGDRPAEIQWRYKRGSPTMPSPILVGQELYFVSDNGILTCLDALTGTEHYRERLGGNFSSSPLLADGRIYVGNREGKMFVIQPGREFRLLAENQLPGGLYATPIAVDRSLLIRTDRGLHRIDKVPSEASKSSSGR